MKTKYETWYNRLCERGRNRATTEYTEKHHIIPESFFIIRKRNGPSGWVDGNSDDPSNITRLTDREHELAHYLLAKIYKNDKRAYHKVIRAYEMRSLVNQNQEDKRHFSSKRLCGIRAERARLQSELMRGENNPQYGRKWTDEEREAQRQKVLGNQLTPEQHDRLIKSLAERTESGIKRKPFTDEYKERCREQNTGEKNPMYGRKHSDSSKVKMGDANRGRKQTDEEKQRRGQANLGKKREKKHCDWCNEDVAVNGYARFHGDNCHMNPSSPRYNPSKKKR